jgi:Cys-tRNA(Pro)/Cys-tRNA(Cys) deacylase
MATRGVLALTKQKIEHEVVSYDFRKKGATYAAEVIGLDPGRVIKSLVAKLSDGRFVFALMPATADLSVKKLGRVCKVKNVEMASQQDAERVTGYLVGGISPLGARKRMEVFLHEDLSLGSERVVINAGARGTLVSVRADDLIHATNAKAVDLAT